MPSARSAKLAWFSGEELAEFGLPIADALFLGVDAAGNGHFAMAVTEHRTRHVPGAIEKLRPIVDLRSLAMQGIMSPEELSLCGQARALAQWHENARCCGHCGGTTLVKDGGWRRKCWACGLEWFPRTDPGGDHADHATASAACWRTSTATATRCSRRWPASSSPARTSSTPCGARCWRRPASRSARCAFIPASPGRFPHSLMLGCMGRAQTTEITVDTTEIAEARWFPRQEARLMLERRHPEGLTVPGKHAIANTLITSFVEEA